MIRIEFTERSDDEIASTTQILREEHVPYSIDRSTRERYSVDSQATSQVVAEVGNSTWLTHATTIRRFILGLLRDRRPITITTPRGTRVEVSDQSDIDAAVAAAMKLVEQEIQHFDKKNSGKTGDSRPRT